MSGWTETYSGRRFFLSAPTVEMIDPLDIGHALSMHCRYNGHVHTFYSVAEHSALLQEAVEDRLGGADEQLWALLHDASEAYLPDVPAPMKALLPEYKAHEERVMRVVCERFGLEWPEPELVRELDRRIVTDEAQWLMFSRGEGWGGGPGLGVRPTGWSPATARAIWLARFERLTGEKVDRNALAQGRKRA
jgi:hypothetical protein